MPIRPGRGHRRRDAGQRRDDDRDQTLATAAAYRIDAIAGGRLLERSGGFETADRDHAQPVVRGQVGLVAIRVAVGATRSAAALPAWSNPRPLSRVDTANQLISHSLLSSWRIRSACTSKAPRSSSRLGSPVVRKLQDVPPPFVRTLTRTNASTASSSSDSGWMPRPPSTSPIGRRCSAFTGRASRDVPLIPVRLSGSRSRVRGQRHGTERHACVGLLRALALVNGLVRVQFDLEASREDAFQTRDVCPSPAVVPRFLTEPVDL